MDTLEDLVQLIHAESERLTHSLHTLSPESWHRPSACALWEIHDVVGHLTWLAEFSVGIISRGVHGDASVPAARRPGDAPTTPSFNAYIPHRTIPRRKHMAAQL